MDHGSPKAGACKVDEKRTNWNAIIDSGKKLNTYQPWMDAKDEEAKLNYIILMPIFLQKTAFSQFDEKNKQQLKATIKMTG